MKRRLWGGLECLPLKAEDIKQRPTDFHHPAAVWWESRCCCRIHRLWWSPKQTQTHGQTLDGSHTHTHTHTEAYTKALLNACTWPGLRGINHRTPYGEVNLAFWENLNALVLTPFVLKCQGTTKLSLFKDRQDPCFVVLRSAWPPAVSSPPKNFPAQSSCSSTDCFLVVTWLGDWF